MSSIDLHTQYSYQVLDSLCQNASQGTLVGDIRGTEGMTGKLNVEKTTPFSHLQDRFVIRLPPVFRTTYYINVINSLPKS